MPKDDLLGKFSVFLIDYSDVSSLHSINGLTSVELQIDIRKLFFALIVTIDGMSSIVRDIFRFRAKEYFRNPDCIPAGFMGDIVRLLRKYISTHTLVYG